jgi:integrase
MVDNAGMMPAPAEQPEKGDQPMKRSRHRNSGLRKRCGCPRKVWPKCPHSWYLNFKPRGGPHYQLSLDRELGRHLDSKSEAEAEATRIRAAILDGTFRVSAPESPASALTFGDVATRYLDSYVRTRLRPGSAEQARYHLRTLQRAEVPTARGETIRLEGKPLDAITKADIEAVRRERRTHGVVGTNRLLARLRHLFNWAIAEGYIDKTPFKRGGVSVVKLETAAEQPRHRRLAPVEEENLLKHAKPHLHALIIAALETGCRLGELLHLQWRDVREIDNVLLLPAKKTKDDEARDVPITSRLRAVLEMRRLDRAGRPFGPEAFVFGNEIGESVAAVKKAWETAVLRAHGHTPQWERGKNRLKPESRAAYHAINLHFHDLRREFASRLREAPGISDHEVRDWLGHANITTTSRYLATTRTTLQQARKKFEQHRSRCTSVVQTADPTSLSDSLSEPVTPVRSER